MCIFLGRADIVFISISEIHINKLSGLSHLYSPFFCQTAHSTLSFNILNNDAIAASHSGTSLWFRDVKGSWLHAGLSSTPACPDSDHRKDGIGMGSSNSSSTYLQHLSIFALACCILYLQPDSKFI